MCPVVLNLFAASVFPSPGPYHPTVKVDVTMERMGDDALVHASTMSPATDTWDSIPSLIGSQHGRDVDGTAYSVHDRCAEIQCALWIFDVITKQTHTQRNGLLPKNDKYVQISTRISVGM